MKVSGYTELTLQVNGQRERVIAKPNTSLLHVLRESIGLTGAKGGCENGDCGACTVLLDGQPIKACMTLAFEVGDRQVTTIEGLSDTEIQEAFIAFNGFQCGYCTSGFLLNAYALLETKPNATEEEKKEWLSANLCRCTGYEGIRDAVNDAQEKVLQRVDHLSVE